MHISGTCALTHRSCRNAVFFNNGSTRSVGGNIHQVTNAVFLISGSTCDKSCTEYDRGNNMPCITDYLLFE
jgi:hypothetical protein